GNQQVFSISHSVIRIPESLPLRFRRIEVPELQNSAEEKLALRIQRNMNLLSWQKSHLSENIRERVVRNLHQPPRPVNITACYPLVVSAHRTLRSITQKKVQFFIRFPEPLEILFDHLRWALRYVRVSGMTFSSNFFTQKASREEAEFSIQQQFNLAAHLNFDDRAQHYHRLNQRGKREVYPIANLRLRDLMNLARQTTQKFNEVNEKMRA
ncbi:MAG: hypothetical protein PHD82_09790, partial [Candidatus Riflebacteria bacterium]|nr:hypothetical protein [Candidatus Riflebacteria bacterium]